MKVSDIRESHVDALNKERNWGAFLNGIRGERGDYTEASSARYREAGIIKELYAKLADALLRFERDYT